MKILPAIILFLTVTISLTHGQNLQIKKKIEVVMTFDYNHMKDGKFFFSKEPTIHADTTITEFNEDGSLKNLNPDVIHGKVHLLDSTVLISENNDFKHEREYWSDSTIVNSYTQNFGDSTVQTKIFEQDTIQINKSYFKNNKLIKSDHREFRPNYYRTREIRLYDVKTENREVATVITTVDNGFTDSIKIDYNERRRIYKTYVYNHYKKEWYIKEKIEGRKKKSVRWDTFYHDFHEVYFTTKTTITLNENRLPKSEIVYDTYLNRIEKKIIYHYEYY